MFCVFMLVDASVLIQAFSIDAVDLGELTLRQMLTFDATLFLSWAGSMYPTLALNDYDRSPTGNFETQDYYRTFFSFLNVISLTCLPCLVWINLKVISEPSRFPSMKNDPTERISTKNGDTGSEIKYTSRGV